LNSYRKKPKEYIGKDLKNNPGEISMDQNMWKEN
jgi:hypothetical protein